MKYFQFSFEIKVYLLLNLSPLLIFHFRECVPRKTLGDLIMEKINEKKTEIETQFSDSTQVMK